MVFWFSMPVWGVLFYLGWTETERFVEGVTLGAV
jgi:hypothetical protein